MYGLLILDSNKCYNWEPLSWSILIHPSSPLKAATCAGVCPSLSLIFTSGVYCSSVRRHSLCPPTHTSWRGVRPVFVLETGLWFCYRDVIKYIFHNYWFLNIMLAFYSDLLPSVISPPWRVGHMYKRCVAVSSQKSPPPFLMANFLVLFVRLHYPLYLLLFSK